VRIALGIGCPGGEAGGKFIKFGPFVVEAVGQVRQNAVSPLRRYGAVISDDGSRAINCQPESGGNRVAVDLQVLLLLSFDDNVKTVLSCVSVAVTLKEGCDAKVLMMEVSMVDWLTFGAVCRGRHV
jgi:hypothetical protein